MNKRNVYIRNGPHYPERKHNQILVQLKNGKTEQLMAILNLETEKSSALTARQTSLETGNEIHSNCFMLSLITRHADIFCHFFFDEHS